MASSPSLVWEHAKVGSPLEDVVCLPEDGPRTARVVKGQVGAGQLQQGLDRHDGERVGELLHRQSGFLPAEYERHQRTP